MVTKTTRARTLYLLRRLRHMAMTGTVADKGFGICYNLEQLGVNSAYLLVSTVSMSWPERFEQAEVYMEDGKGRCSYPIPRSDTVGLWEGEQLEKRLSLIDHLIVRVKQGDSWQTVQSPELQW